MTSQIDPSKPATGMAFTSDMRANFYAAYNEISALQLVVEELTGGVDLSELQAQIDALKADVLTLKARQMAAASMNIAAPPNTGSAAFVTAGIGVQFTPHNSTRAIFQLDGNLGNASNGQQSEARLVYGTGAAPSFGTLVTATNGQFIGNTASMTAAKVNDATPFTTYALIENLLAGTQYWIGLGFRAVGGTATLTQMGLVAFEVIDPIP